MAAPARTTAPQLQYPPKMPSTYTAQPPVFGQPHISASASVEIAKFEWLTGTGATARRTFLFSWKHFAVAAFSAVPAFAVQYFHHLQDPDLLPELAAFLFLYAILVGLASPSRSHQIARRKRQWSEPIFGVLVATFVLLVFALLTHSRLLSPALAVQTALLTLTVSSAAELLQDYVARRRSAVSPCNLRRVLIVGAGPVGREVADILSRSAKSGYLVSGFLDDSCAPDSAVLGHTSHFRQVAQTHFTDEVILTPPLDDKTVHRIVAHAHDLHIAIRIVPEIFHGAGWRGAVDYLGDYPVVPLAVRPIPTISVFFKRAIDIVFSVCALILAAPVLLACAVAVRFTSDGPILYRSQRVGKKGRRFEFYKFRTMVRNADDLKDALRNQNERQGPLFKITDDPRITPVGRFLRKYSFDELPQLWNVLKGDMSLIGPRPPSLDDHAQYSLDHLRRLSVRPGLTGLWQVTARSEASFDTCMAADLAYIDNWSWWLDTKILFQTIPAVFRGRGV